MTEEERAGLRRIAEEMRQYALAHPRTATTGDIAPYRRGLKGGLRVVLFIDIYYRWNLSLYRAREFPKQGEVAAIRQAFDVPPFEAVETRHEIDVWRIIRLKWKEISQRKLFEVAPTGEGYS